jgi:cytochrome c oxidase subunit 2
MKNVTEAIMKHAVIVAVLVLASTFLIHSGLAGVNLLPAQASAQAVAVDQIFGIHLWFISFLFSLIVVTLLYSLVVFRRKKGETGDGAHIEGNTGLEVTWTLLPFLAVIFLAYVGAESLGEVRRIDPSALVVKVISGQWYWQYQYPDYGVTATELYLPVGRQTKLQMTSVDVIHSFWVPEFRVKQDLVPGQTTELRITPTTAGRYKVRCAELCGTSHTYMEGAVYVVTQPEFEAWVARQQSTVSLDPALRGEQLATQYGCTACHSTDGSRKTGPTWAKLYEAEVPLADGRTVRADREYLVESIVNPNLRIVAGYSANVMPSFAETLDQAAIESIVTYIETLK